MLKIHGLTNQKRPDQMLNGSDRAISVWYWISEGGDKEIRCWSQMLDREVREIGLWYWKDNVSGKRTEEHTVL